MTKKLWIFNHYAVDYIYSKGSRHFNFARHLINRDFEVTIFSANTVHNSNKIFAVENGIYRIIFEDGIRYVVVKTVPYSGNGLSRILNMLVFARNLKKIANRLINNSDKPDVILASSVHPWTIQSGLKIAKKHHIPCICEIRDLWPETLISLGKLKRNSVFTKYLYKKEKWMYERADKLIFTMKGGIDYIKDKGWDIDNGGTIDSNKVSHINNGVDLQKFDTNVELYSGLYQESFKKGFINFVYAGSIREANNLDLVLIPISKLLDKGVNINCVIIGEGNERKALEQKYRRYSNIVFKGYVEKNKIPSILVQSDICLLCNHATPVLRYGASQNKVFEYMAAGKPILSTAHPAYDIISENELGVSLSNPSNDLVEEAINMFINMPECEREEMGKKARKVSKDYDFYELTNKLLLIIEELIY